MTYIEIHSPAFSKHNTLSIAGVTYYSFINRLVNDFWTNFLKAVTVPVQFYCFNVIVYCWASILILNFRILTWRFETLTWIQGVTLVMLSIGNLGWNFLEKARFFKRAQATKSNDSAFSLHIELVSKYCMLDTIQDFSIA